MCVPTGANRSEGDDPFFQLWPRSSRTAFVFVPLHGWSSFSGFEASHTDDPG